MREIKFRGKQLNTGKWVYGSLIQYSNPETTPDIYDPETSQYLAVYPDTVGQYTGVKDCNGVEIYEGDIIDTFHEKWPKNLPGKFYANGTPSREVKWITGEHHNGWNIYFGSHSRFKVIRNIYENQELLNA